MSIRKNNEEDDDNKTSFIILKFNALCQKLLVSMILVNNYITLQTIIHYLHYFHGCFLHTCENAVIRFFLSFYKTLNTTKFSSRYYTGNLPIKMCYTCVCFFPPFFLGWGALFLGKTCFELDILRKCSIVCPPPPLNIFCVS